MIFCCLTESRGASSTFLCPNTCLLTSCSFSRYMVAAISEMEHMCPKKKLKLKFTGVDLRTLLQLPVCYKGRRSMFPHSLYQQLRTCMMIFTPTRLGFFFILRDFRLGLLMAIHFSNCDELRFVIDQWPDYG